MATATKLATIAAAATKPVRLLSAADVAAITGLSMETLAQWRSHRKGIAFIKISRNCVRYRQSDLDSWLEKRIVRVEEDPFNARRNY